MRLALLLALTLGFASVPLVSPRDAYADPEAPSISIVAARKLALARVPGTIINEKLKSKTKQTKVAVWSIKIRPRSAAAGSDQLTKVEVDATTGAIVKVKASKARKSSPD